MLDCALTATSCRVASHRSGLGRLQSQASWLVGSRGRGLLRWAWPDPVGVADPMGVARSLGVAGSRGRGRAPRASAVRWALVGRCGRCSSSASRADSACVRRPGVFTTCSLLGCCEGGHASEWGDLSRAGQGPGAQGPPQSQTPSVSGCRQQTPTWNGTAGAGFTGETQARRKGESGSEPERPRCPRPRARDSRSLHGVPSG